jgi:hypothetical protein
MRRTVGVRAMSSRVDEDCSEGRGRGVSVRANLTTLLTSAFVRGDRVLPVVHYYSTADLADLAHFSRSFLRPILRAPAGHRYF